MKVKTILTLIKSSIIYICSFIILGIALFLIAAQIEPNYKTIATILNSCGATFITIGVLSSWIEILNAAKLIDMINLFGDHKDEGIERLFPQRNTEYQELRTSLLETCKVYKASTLVGRQYINEQENVDNTIELAKKCSEFELLFMESSATGYEYRFEHQEPKGADIIGASEDQKVEIKKSQILIKEALKDDANKTVLHYKTLSPFNLEFMDEYLFISFYGIKVRGLKSPILLLKKNKNSVTYEYFSRQYEQLRNEAT